MAKNSPLAMRAAKEVMIDCTERMINEALNAKDAMKGSRAFMEKYEPIYRSPN